MVDRDDAPVSSGREPGPNQISSGSILNYFGHGYCPVTENRKSNKPLAECSSDNKQQVRIGRKVEWLPNYVEVTGDPSGTSLVSHQCCFLNQEEYQSHKRSWLGLEVGWSLIVAVGAEGRWLDIKNNSSENLQLKYSWKRVMSILRINNLNTRTFTPQFESDLNGLPDTYTSETLADFQRFFNKWGSHIVNEVHLGGILNWNGTLNRGSNNASKVRQIGADLSGIISNAQLGVEASAMRQTVNNMSWKNELLSESFDCKGGQQTRLRLETLDPSTLQEWVNSVGENPVELSPELIRLEAYYNLLSGAKSDALRQATKDRLGRTESTRVATYAVVNDVGPNTRAGLAEAGLRAVFDNSNVSVPAVNKPRSNCQIL